MQQAAGEWCGGVVACVAGSDHIKKQAFEHRCNTHCYRNQTISCSRCQFPHHGPRMQCPLWCINNSLLSLLCAAATAQGTRLRDAAALPPPQPGTAGAAAPPLPAGADIASRRQHLPGCVAVQRPRLSAAAATLRQKRGASCWGVGVGGFGCLSGPAQLRRSPWCGS
jgi:hypothetical protein